MGEPSPGRTVPTLPPKPSISEPSRARLPDSALRRALTEHLRAMPAVVVSGARQTGKRTLVRVFVPGEHRFLWLDDLDVADLPRRDPEALVGGSTPATLDEVPARTGLTVGGEARDRPPAAAGSVPAHRLRQPSAHAPGVGVAGRAGGIAG